jgi:hypothetical protein
MSVGILPIKKTVKKAPMKKGGLGTQKAAAPKKIAKVTKAVPGNTTVKVAKKIKKAMVKKSKAVGGKGVKKAKATNRLPAVEQKNDKRMIKSYMKGVKKIHKIKNKGGLK